MRIEELAYLCEEAARDLASRSERPVPAAVVVPGMPSSRIVELPDFPPDDETRARVLDALAQREIVEAARPAYGFMAEAETADRQEVVVVVYGARSHPPRVTAAGFREDGALGEFAPAEPLDPAALPFLHPLQHAAESVSAG